MGRHLIRAALLSGLLASAPAMAANVIPGNWTLLSSTGIFGTLRAGSPWGPGSTAPVQFFVVDGAFAPESQQWNNGSWWWDADPSVNPNPVTGMVINLNQAYTIDRLVVQADDNDTYSIEYWDGANWQLAWNIPAVFSFGLTTRDSGILPAFTTTRLRFNATGGDNYYSVSEIQAFAPEVPEPGTWALMLAGFGLAGTALRRRSSTRVAVSYA